MRNVKYIEKADMIVARSKAKPDTCAERDVNRVDVRASKRTGRICVSIMVKQENQ